MSNVEDISRDFNNDDFEFLESEIDEIDQLQEIRIDVNEGLQSAINELEDLKDEFNQSTTDNLLTSIQEMVIGTVTSQLGVGFLVHKDGGNVTTPHGFENGTVSNEEDRKSYEAYVENQDKEWNKVRTEAKYDKSLPQIKKKIFQENETIEDAYTGKELSKDGTTHLDHIVPVKEIESTAENHLFLSVEERVKMTTNDKNLALTSSQINQSKGDKSMKKYISPDNRDKKTNKSKADTLRIDKDKAMAKDKTARKHIHDTVSQAKFKKYSKELLVSGGKDAAKIMAYSAIGVVVREFTQGTFLVIKEIFVNRHGKKFGELFKEFCDKMKSLMKNILHKWKDILKGSFEAGITAFFSNLLVFVINIFFTTIKKIVVMIRVGFTSLVQAIKIIANPPQGMTKEEAKYQASKLLVAGIIGGVSIGLSAAVEKCLQAIPGLQPIMMFPIMGNRTVSDVIAVTLSAILGGVLSTMVLYLMDSTRSNEKKAKLQIQMVAKSGEILQYRTVQSYFALYDAYKFLESEMKNMRFFIGESKKRIDASLVDVKRANQYFTDLVDKI